MIHYQNWLFDTLLRYLWYMTVWSLRKFIIALNILYLMRWFNFDSRLLFLHIFHYLLFSLGNYIIFNHIYVFAFLFRRRIMFLHIAISFCLSCLIVWFWKATIQLSDILWQANSLKHIYFHIFCRNASLQTDIFVDFQCWILE